MITSTRNPRVVAARKLTQRKHRQRQNRFLVEGLQLLGMAVEAATTADACSRIKPQEVFYSQDLFTGPAAPRLLAELAELGGEPVAVAPKVLNTISERDTSQGLAATFALRELEQSFDELELTIPAKPTGTKVPDTTPSTRRPTVPFILVLDKLQDPGNLGTLIRTANAVGVRAAILIEPCVDPFDLKTVRGTMGSIFTVPFVRIEKIDEILPHLTKLGYSLVGADASQGHPPWQRPVLRGPVALILGNEARGLSPELHRYVEDYVSLPLCNQVDSLNVAVAGGVLMYEWLRLNSDPTV